MELKKARVVTANEAIIILYDRVAELEAQRDELLEMLIYWIKDKRHITIKSLEAIKLICFITGKTWEEINDGILKER